MVSQSKGLVTFLYSCVAAAVAAAALSTYRVRCKDKTRVSFSFFSFFLSPFRVHRYIIAGVRFLAQATPTQHENEKMN